MTMIALFSEGVVVRVAKTVARAMVYASFIGSDMALKVGFEITLGLFQDGLCFFCPKWSGTAFYKCVSYALESLECLGSFR